MKGLIRLLLRIRAYLRLVPRFRRNRLDLVRVLARRPLLALAGGAYESAILLSNALDPRLKSLAALRVAGLVGCPF